MCILFEYFFVLTLNEFIKNVEIWRKGGIALKYDAYLFDFDGTLVDSMPSFISVMLRILDENNIKYDDDIVKIITPLGYAGTAAYFKKMGVPLSEAKMIKIMNEYIRDEYAYKIQAKTNVISTLQELKKRGADLNVLTASPHSVLDPCLKRLKIYEANARAGGLVMIFLRRKQIR